MPDINELSILYIDIVWRCNQNMTMYVNISIVVLNLASAQLTVIHACFTG